MLHAVNKNLNIFLPLLQQIKQTISETTTEWTTQLKMLKKDLKKKISKETYEGCLLYFGIRELKKLFIIVNRFIVF